MFRALAMGIRTFAIWMLACSAFAGEPVQAEATLGPNLTPLGGEAQGNADGSIPRWEPYSGPAAVAPPGSLLADDRPLLRITASNLEQYASRLSDGTKALLRKHPETFRLDVYATRRTADAPKYVYEATLRNGRNAHLVDGPGGPVPADAYAGIPFPIPKTGVEAMWNHLMRWRGYSFRRQFANYLITADGKRVTVDGGIFDVRQPYYDPRGSAADFGGEYALVRIDSDAPPDRKGVAYVERDNVNAEKNGAWAYLPGQRRVRKLPNSCCDVPLPSAAGAITNDEPDVWDGRLDRYDWKLLGKIELYVPYNTNASLRASIDDLIGKTHLNPDHVRWELHRVWVVEGNLAAGKRHAMVKSRYYLDEDTWMALLGDRWAESGALAKTLWTLPLWLPAIPAVAAATSGSYDLATGTWVVMAAPIGRTEPYKVMPSFNDAHFTPDALTAEGVR
jgi:hypothetical protein